MKTYQRKLATWLISIFSISPLCAQNSAWLTSMPDKALVRTLSIPGAHDAATGNGFLITYQAIQGWGSIRKCVP